MRPDKRYLIELAYNYRVDAGRGATPLRPSRRNHLQTLLEAKCCDVHVCSCVCLFVFLSANTSPKLRVHASPIFVQVTHDRGSDSVLFCRRGDMLSTCGFMDGVMFTQYAM